MNAEEKFGRLDPTELMGIIIGYAPNRRIDLQVAFRDRILALVRPAPPALDLGVVRRILTDALPADPKWVGWVEGRIEEIAAVTPSAGVVLTHRDAQTALGWYADAFRDGETPAGYDRDLAQKLGEAFR